MMNNKTEQTNKQTTPLLQAILYVLGMLIKLCDVQKYDDDMTAH